MQRWGSEQLELRSPLPVVVGNVDYLANETRFRRMDAMLRQGGLEETFSEMAVAQWIRESREHAEKKGRSYSEPSFKALGNYARMCRKALRCNLARQLVGKEFRPFSLRLAESALLQWFCGIDRLEAVRVPTKSTLERYDKLLPESQMRELVNRLTQAASEEPSRLDLPQAISLDVCLLDSTCVKANIHFPIDWVLLRDAVRTLIQAIKVIRKHGLKCRMPDPDGFLKAANRLSIEMSQSRRRDKGSKLRKNVLRRLKRLARLVRKHATRYSERLQAVWKQQTDLSEAEMKRIVERMTGVISQLPAAIRQAHERIIGGRMVRNKEKILSLYESDLHVIVRNKADAEVEFGNTLLLAEQADGLIVDWSLEKEASAGDIALMKVSVGRFQKAFGRCPSVIGADRGFSSKAAREWLKKKGIGDGVCPRDPHELAERMKNRKFRGIQKRRAQTEGRIGILKNDFLGRPMRSKGFAHRQLAVAWAVLAHNFWLLAGLKPAVALPLAA
jgi:hypothetical protein